MDMESGASDMVTQQHQLFRPRMAGEYELVYSECLYLPP